MVLRCNDCIKYHVGKAHELKITTEELYEIFAVANIEGGTIVIPDTRRAAEYWEVLQESEYYSTNIFTLSLKLILTAVFGYLNFRLLTYIIVLFPIMIDGLPLKNFLKKTRSLTFPQKTEVI